MAAWAAWAAWLLINVQPEQVLCSWMLWLRTSDLQMPAFTSHDVSGMGMATFTLHGFLFKSRLLTPQICCDPAFGSIAPIIFEKNNFPTSHLSDAFILLF